MSDSTLPVIDFSGFEAEPARSRIASELNRACREAGFFYLQGHGVPPELTDRLEQISRTFFAQDQAKKLEIEMVRSGRAWRGYFPVGAELTRGQIDQKEGIYFGEELPEDHPKVRKQLPLHGPNLFPDLDGFRDTVLRYLDCMTCLSHRIMQAISLSLELQPDYFSDRYTYDPLILFRIFHYPRLSVGRESDWSVGEHTDYGLLTVLWQDCNGGLQVRCKNRWVAAEPIPGAFVCNIGDMLDRVTSGRYRSTPHRVRNAGNAGRLSFPFFFDPGFDARVEPIDADYPVPDDAHQRWDRVSVHDIPSRYGDYILSKVGKVFPDLGREVL